MHSNQSAHLEWPSAPNSFKQLGEFGEQVRVMVRAECDVGGRMNCCESKLTWNGGAIGEATTFQLHDISCHC
jgi:hypothetical protein